MTTVRTARLSDLEAITAIYNHEVLHGSATFDTEPKHLEEQLLWFGKHDERHPLLVATPDSNGEVLGWASLSAWSDRCAYAGTVENSIYVAPQSRGTGVGKLLLGDLLRVAAEAGTHTVLARIADGNPASVHLHERAGFRHVGRMFEVGYKFGRWIDVLVMQKMLLGRGS
ncbi:MAG: N-acetyltransferase [Candidatus Schekmanbacteria bacterium]|nr:N-acetyltransferase [Candidatus Schekmanbacteria bacterium]